MFSFFQRHAHAAIFFLRAGSGMVFIYHGYLKIFAAGGIERFASYLGGHGFPFSQALAYLSGGAEFFGGCMVALGLLTRQASMILIINIGVLLIFIHRRDAYPQMEQEVQMLILSIATLYSGSGSFSLEGLVKRHGD